MAAHKLEKSLEALQQQVVAYEQGTAETRAALDTFGAEHGEQLAAIQNEYEDYGRHPLWQQHAELDAATHEPAAAYDDWYAKGRVLGWERKILLCGTENFLGSNINSDRRGFSVLPPTLEEFERRADIARDVGKVAVMLHAANGQPIVSVASYPGALELKREGNDKLKRWRNPREYRFGRLASRKIRARVGLIDQVDTEPVLSVQPTAEKDNRQSDLNLRLTMAGNLAGTVSAFGVPSDKQFKRSLVYPSYYQTRGFRSDRWRNLPVGNSVLGDFPLKQLRNHDLLVIDAPHRTAADYEFPEDVLLHRPKQRIAAEPPSCDQEIAVMPNKIIKGPDAGTHEAIVIGENGAVSLPTYRHDTIWLVGVKAIETCLGIVIAENTAAENKRRGADRALLRATEDLVEQVANAAA